MQRLIEPIGPAADRIVSIHTKRFAATDNDYVDATKAADDTSLDSAIPAD